MRWSKIGKLRILILDWFQEERFLDGNSKRGRCQEGHNGLFIRHWVHCAIKEKERERERGITIKAAIRGFNKVLATTAKHIREQHHLSLSLSLYPFLAFSAPSHHQSHATITSLYNLKLINSLTLSPPIMVSTISYSPLFRRKRERERSIELHNQKQSKESTPSNSLPWPSWTKIYVEENQKLFKRKKREVVWCF